MPVPDYCDVAHYPVRIEYLPRLPAQARVNAASDEPPVWDSTPIPASGLDVLEGIGLEPPGVVIDEIDDYGVLIIYGPPDERCWAGFELNVGVDSYPLGCGPVVTAAEDARLYEARVTWEGFATLFCSARGFYGVGAWPLTYRQLADDGSLVGEVDLTINILNREPTVSWRIGRTFDDDTPDNDHFCVGPEGCAELTDYGETPIQVNVFTRSYADGYRVDVVGPAPHGWRLDCNYNNSACGIHMDPTDDDIGEWHVDHVAVDEDGSRVPFTFDFWVDPPGCGSRSLGPMLLPLLLLGRPRRSR